MQRRRVLRLSDPAIKMPSVDELADLAILSLRRATVRDGVSVPVMVLIDRAVADPFEEATNLDEATRQVVRIAHDDLSEDKLPYLLCLSTPERSERLLNATVRLAVQEAQANLRSSRQIRSVCAWIQLQDSAEAAAQKDGLALAMHVARASVARSPEGERRLFRYFDPRVLERLEAVARPGQWAHLLGRSATWHYLGRDLSLRTVRSPASAEGEASFDAPQWARLARIGWVNELLPQAAEWGLSGPATEVAERIDAQLARAQGRGLLTDTDCMTFATCAFCVHPRFDEHPVFARALAAAGRGELSFADAAASLDEQQLEDVAAGVWLADSPRSHRHG